MAMTAVGRSLLPSHSTGIPGNPAGNGGRMPGDVHYQRSSPRGEDREAFVNLQKTFGLIGEVGPQGRCERAHHEQWNAVNAC